MGQRLIAIGAAVYGWAETPGIWSGHSQRAWKLAFVAISAILYAGVVASQITFSLLKQYNGDMTAVTAWWGRMMLAASSPDVRQQEIAEFGRSRQGLDLLQRVTSRLTTYSCGSIS